MGKKDENPLLIPRDKLPKDKMDLINEVMSTQGIGSDSLYRPELFKKSPQYTPEDLKMVYKKVKQLSPMEVLELNFYKKDPDEVSAEEVYNIFGQPEEIMVDEASGKYIPVIDLIRSGEIGKGDYLILVLMYLMDSYENDDNTEADIINCKIRMLECKKLLEVFPPSNKTLIKVLKDDKYGKFYGDVIWRFSNDLTENLDATILEGFKNEFNTNGRDDIFVYSNQAMTNEFIGDDEVRNAFNTIVNENTNYMIREEEEKTGTPLTDVEKTAIYCGEFRKILLKNYGPDNCMDENHILLSYLYRYMCDIALECKENFQSGKVLDTIEDLERLLSIVQKKKTIDAKLTPEDFAEEEIKQLEELGVPTNIQGLNAATIHEIISEVVKKCCESVKENILQNPQLISQLDQRIISKIEFSSEDIIKLDQECDETTMASLRKNCPGFDKALAEMKRNIKELSKDQIEFLLKYGLITKKDLVDKYMTGDLPEESMELIGKDEQEVLPQIDYWKLISEYEEIIKIKDVEKREKAIELLKRKINIYKANLGDNFDSEIEEKSYEFAVYRAEEYEENKSKNKPNGITSKELEELYNLGLVSLGSVASLDSEVLVKLFRLSQQGDKKISMWDIIDLYDNGMVLAKEIKELVLDGSVPAYLIKDITGLNLTNDEAMKLLEERKITAKNILSLYNNGTISISDLENYINTLPTEEDKYMFIYGNFAGKGFEPIFNILVNQLAAYTDSHSYTGTGTRPIVPNPIIRPEEKPIPSKLRWEFLSSLDKRFHIESLPDGYIAYIYPSLDRVLVEQMRKMKKGKKVDSYGVATRGMTIDEYYYYKPGFVTSSKVDRSALVALSKKGLIESIEHFPTTWGRKVLEHVNGYQIDTIQDPNRKFEIEYMLEELREEIEKSR